MIKREEEREELELSICEEFKETDSEALQIGTGKVDFPMCSHPELWPTMFEQPKPGPVRTIGRCPLHDYTCPLCGFGIGCAPSCDCPEQRY
ncbi:hypothetical protein ES703_34071 [subsurface metagenome]